MRGLELRHVVVPRGPLSGDLPFMLSWGIPVACTLCGVVVIDDVTGFRDRSVIVDVAVHDDPGLAVAGTQPLVAWHQGIEVSNMPRIPLTVGMTLSVAFRGCGGRELLVVPLVELHHA